MKTIKLLAVLGIIGLLLVSGCSSKEDPVDPGKDKETTTVSDETVETVWTCSMHPEIRESEPGSCPKCNMKLIKAEK
jgi:Cu(I)/Ag(I) efflux system membrane fusion protein